MHKFSGFFAVIILVCGWSCSDDATHEPDIPPVEDPWADYKAPSYADDYSVLSGWSQRMEWNLANVHDPSVVYDGNYYYMYGTDASYGNVHEGQGHFPYRRSKDLVTWDFKGMAMRQTPAWVADSLNNMRISEGLPAITNPVYGHWAPVVRKVGSKYRMYYSIIVDNYIKTGLSNTAANFDNSWTERAFIGMMETSSLSSNIWVDKGMVICSVSDKGSNWSRKNRETDWNAYFKWNAIDPTYVETPSGDHYLIYGSWHSGNVSVKIDPETGKPYQLKKIEDFGTLIARRQNSDANRWQAQEGAEVIYNAETGYYYMFLAYDELSVAYNTRVCRATNINGPYKGIDGINVSQGGDCWPMLTHPYKFNSHSGWVGISHCAVFKNETTGDWFYASQGRLPANTNGNAYSNAIMMGHIRRIRWTDNGWPVVMPERFSNTPQPAITDADLVGTWENITMVYQYQKQQTSTAVVLLANKTATGSMNGNWSYDAAKKVLTIGSQTLCVGWELDWEASPRVPTIVYSGLTANGHPIWGKLKK